MWRIWFKRNRKVHDNSVIHEEDVVNWAVAFLNDFWRANEQTVDSVNGRVGFGIVIRDSAGSVLAASAQQMDFDYSPRVVEALALLRGSSLAQEV
ncbi:hypothetical protein Q3G72_031343 [Acer saccharum]|nr:hypothetical protein Q3G72_031343 [Acer saccharum]